MVPESAREIICYSYVVCINKKIFEGNMNREEGRGKEEAEEKSMGGHPSESYKPKEERLVISCKSCDHVTKLGVGRHVSIFPTRSP